MKDPIDMKSIMLFLAKHRRLYSVFIVIPFVIWADPEPLSLGIGIPVMLGGMLFRAWSSGYIYKDRSLAVAGPYSIVRNPLYFGSYIMGTGCMITGNTWVLLALYLLTFPVVYYCLIRTEEERLSRLFGEEYIEYCASVPRLITYPWMYKKTDAQWSFKLTFIDHKEYASASGTAIMILFLFLRFQDIL